ncbi:MAG TPA: thiamine phosphate synthase [Dehalococcoidia bacterium]|nr:thiamine phosphate synthase [Dehalococcoidia bacterium]
MLRTLDANLNRIGEGLRLLEDISRFTLNDPDLSQQLKAMRHELLPKDQALQGKLISARQAEGDVGAYLDVDSEGERSDTVSLVSANAHRVQQSLRVLEEITKIPGQDFGMDWEKLKQARFTLYELEQRILLKLSRRDKTNKISGLYLILDTQMLGERNEVEVARQAIRGGVTVIQLRDKMRAKGELITIAQELKQVCAGAGTLFIVNDYLDVALACEADGLHIGQGDLPLAVARKLLPGDKIVGCSTATLDEAVQAQEQGADYIAVGSIYPTTSKTAIRPAGIDTLRQVKDRVSIPVVAIGGINEDNVAEVMDAGADAVAVMSAVLGASDVHEYSRRLMAAIGGKQ